jgi:hypothetical protein
MEQCDSRERERERERERAKWEVSRVGVLKVERDKISSYNLQVERKGEGGGGEKARVSVTNHLKGDLRRH